MVTSIVMFSKTRTFSSVSLDVAVIGTDNGLHTAPERAAGAGDEGLLQSVPGLCGVSLQ